MIDIAKLTRTLLLTTVGLTAAACVPTEGVTGPDGEEVDTGEQLNFYEEQLVGLWYRYHSYDGSDHYIRFNADRTACKWEEASGSDTRTDRSSYQDWRIDENGPSDGMVIQLQGAGITWYFDYPDDEIWPSSYRSTLARRPSSSSKSCD